MGWLLGIRGVSNGSLCMCASVRAFAPGARVWLCPQEFVCPGASYWADWVLKPSCGGNHIVQMHTYNSQ